MTSAVSGFKQFSSGVGDLATITFAKIKASSGASKYGIVHRKITVTKVIWFFGAVVILALSITGTVVFTKSHPLSRSFTMTCTSGARDCRKEIEPPFWHKGLKIDDASSPFGEPMQDYMLHYYDKKSDDYVYESFRTVVRDVNETISFQSRRYCGFRDSLSYSLKAGDK
ncbi:hypothetical protein HDU76_011398, partial [Blyttiomyces sp. JEL0837]